MTSSPFEEPLEDRRCHVCQHGERDHEVRDVEGDTLKRGYCNACAEWHEFVPEPEP